jgi:flagellar motor switch protein FliN
MINKDLKHEEDLLSDILDDEELNAGEPGGVAGKDELEDIIGSSEKVDIPKKMSAPVSTPKPVHEDRGLADDVLDMASDIPVQIVAVMGKKTITMQDMLNLRIGEVVEMSRPVNEMVDLVANGKLIAKGELVDIDGKLGVRIVKTLK